MRFNKRRGTENHASESGAGVTRKNFAGLPNLGGSF